MAFWFTIATSAAAPATTAGPDGTSSTAAPNTTEVTVSGATQCDDPNGTATMLLVHPTEVTHVPDVEASAAVDAAITLDLDAQPSALLPGVSSLTSVTLEVPCRLQASLTSGADVDISPGGASSRTMTAAGAITWRWDVSGRSPAVLTLRLSGEDGSSISARPVEYEIVLAAEGPSTTTVAPVLPPQTTIDVPDRTTVTASPGPSTGGSTSTTTGGSLTDECRRRTENPAPGTWRPPANATGTVGTTLTVRAVLSADESSAIPPDDATGSSAAPLTILSVFCRVEARLRGQGAEFDTAWFPQRIRTELAAVWVWQVTPTRDGKIPLTVDLRGQAENGEYFELAWPAGFVLTVSPGVDAAGPPIADALTSGRDGSVGSGRGSGTSGQLPGVMMTSAVVVALSGVGFVAYRRRRVLAPGHRRTRPLAAVDDPTGPTRVFLSYSRRDAAAASRLARDLEASGWDVWMDTEDIAGGESWRRSIVDALQSVHAVILVVSPNSMISSNVERELTIADDEGTPVFPVMVAATDLVSGFKYLLAGVQITDISGAAYADGVARVVHAIETHRTGLAAPPAE